MSSVSSGLGAGLSILGALTRAAGQKQSGEVAAAGEQYKALQSDYAAEVQDYQAQVAENNATVARNAGARTVQAGEVGATVAGLKTAATVGKMKASQGASGIDVNTGSAVKVRADAASAGIFDAETILSNAQLANWGYRVQGDTFQTQANLDRSQGGLLRSNANFYRSMAPYAIEGGNIAAAGSLIDTASSVAWKWGGDGAELSTPGGNSGAQASIQAGGGLMPSWGT